MTTTVEAVLEDFWMLEGNREKMRVTYKKY